jgi:puromycin-sensitive aminopeptidase
MHVYLTRHQYKNTTTEDLWQALEESSSKPIADVMSTWTKQMGFPVVKVQSQHANGKRTLTLTQQKFCADGLQLEKACFWMLPINISTPKSENAYTAMLDKPSMVITLDNVSENDWVKINPGTIGFYRCDYPPEMLREFVPAITDKTLPPLDRLGLVDDLFALVQAGQSPTVEVCDFFLFF